MKSWTRCFVQCLAYNSYEMSFKKYCRKSCFYSQFPITVFFFFPSSHKKPHFEIFMDVASVPYLENTVSQPTSWPLTLSLSTSPLSGMFSEPQVEGLFCRCVYWCYSVLSAPSFFKVLGRPCAHQMFICYPNVLCYYRSLPLCKILRFYLPVCVCMCDIGMPEDATSFCQVFCL